MPTTTTADSNDQKPTTSPTTTLTPTTTSKSGERNQAQLTTIAPDKVDDIEGFGNTAGLSSDGTTALIGASDDRNQNGGRAGSAYVFTRSGSTWSQQAQLIASDGDDHEGFGTSVALSADGSVALIGTPKDVNPDVELGGNAGSAYVFARSGSTWRQQAKLTANDSDGGDLFGQSAELTSDGTTALIGAVGDEDPNGKGSGSVYVFSRSGDTWTQQKKLVANDGDSEDLFGSSVGLSDDGSTALIGAWRDEDPNGTGGGSAYLYSRSGGTWTQQTKLAPDELGRSAGFGYSVDLSNDGSTALIGAIGGSVGAGLVYVYSESGSTWRLQSKMAANDADDSDGFGSSIGISRDGTTALIGALGDEDPNGEQGGSAYVFSRTGGTWSQQAKLAAPDGGKHREFGRAVDITADGSTGLISQNGAAYVFNV